MYGLPPCPNIITNICSLSPWPTIIKEPLSTKVGNWIGYQIYWTYENAPAFSMPLLHVTIVYKLISVCTFYTQIQFLDLCFMIWRYSASVLVLTCRSSASLLSSTDCVSPKQRRWPEDIAWHPQGNCLFSVYSADGGDSQISVLNLNKTQGVRVTLDIGYWMIILVLFGYN